MPNYNKPSTEYLYGVPASELPSMDDGLIARINAATTLRNQLLEEPLLTRDIYRLNKVLNAIEHNTLLLEGAL